MEKKKFAQGIHGFESMRLVWTNEIFFDGIPARN